MDVLRQKESLDRNLPGLGGGLEGVVVPLSPPPTFFGVGRARIFKNEVIPKS